MQELVPTKYKYVNTMIVPCLKGKFTNSKAEWHGFYPPYAKSLPRNKSFRIEPICSVSVGNLSKEARNIIVTSRKNTLLTNMCTWVKTGCSVELQNSRRFDSVVEHSAAVWDAYSSNPSALIWYRENYLEVFTWVFNAEESKMHMMTEGRSWLPPEKLFEF